MVTIVPSQCGTWGTSSLLIAGWSLPPDIFTNIYYSQEVNQGGMRSFCHKNSSIFVFFTYIIVPRTKKLNIYLISLTENY
jgi:hypothetical protein